MSDYEVHVLHDGYSIVLENEGMKANCTCTLIKGSKNKIIVDTMTAWDKDKIIEGLAKHNVQCSDITYLVCTHGHSDHIGNNNLFLNAKHIVGYSISTKSHFLDPQFETGKDYIIDDYVKVTPTPGHTLTDVSVLVETKQKDLIAITGDLFEKVEDLQDETIWLEIGGSEDPDLQMENREKILLVADYIIPGHGPMFKVTDQMRIDIKNQSIDDKRSTLLQICDAPDDDDDYEEEEEEES